MKNLDKLYETLDSSERIKNDSEALAIELSMQLRNEKLFEKIGRLISLLSKRSYQTYRNYMTNTLNRLKNGETPESIIADLEKLVNDTIYVRRHDFKTNLAFIRKERGISQSKLAELSGVNVRMIQHYEQGFKDINQASALTVYKLAEALGVNVGELLEIKK